MPKEITDDLGNEYAMLEQEITNRGGVLRRKNMQSVNTLALVDRAIGKMKTILLKLMQLMCQRLGNRVLVLTKRFSSEANRIPAASIVCLSTDASSVNSEPSNLDVRTKICP